jgi:hypothetical protein
MTDNGNERFTFVNMINRLVTDLEILSSIDLFEIAVEERHDDLSITG